MSDGGLVIVVGAGRSGTNLLRDMICTLPGYTTWPCDEINYIWRHGNRGATTDELTPDDARPEVKRYITHAVERQRRRGSGRVLVEKTCATSLRVGFAQAVFPGAKFVYIVRDGRDVAASALQRWTAALDLRYLARKARFVPVSDLPYYAGRYAKARAARFTNDERRLSSWGPRFTGMDEALRTRTLAEVCALQWRRCVEESERQFKDDVAASAVHRLRYEDLVRHPGDEMGRLADFLGAAAPTAGELPHVSESSIGRWQIVMSETDAQAVSTVVAPVLPTYGYPLGS